MKRALSIVASMNKFQSHMTEERIKECKKLIFELTGCHLIYDNYINEWIIVG